MLRTALTVALVAGLVQLAAAATGALGLFGVLVPLWVVLAAVGTAFPNTPALALSRHAATAGTAAALLGFVQFGVAALVAPLVGVLGNDALAMATVMTGTTAAALAVLLVVRPEAGEAPPV